MEPIIITLILIIIAAVVFKIVKKAIKAILIISGLVFLVLGISLLFLYLDFKELKQHTIADMIFLSEGNGKIIAGSVNSTPISEGQAKEYTDYFASRNYKNILGDKYKLFIIKKELINEVELTPEEQELLNINDSRLQGEMNLYLLQKAVSNPAVMLKGIKNGKVIIYPETTVFRLIKLVPSSMIQSGLENMVEQDKEVQE